MRVRQPGSPSEDDSCNYPTGSWEQQRPVHRAHFKWNAPYRLQDCAPWSPLLSSPSQLCILFSSFIITDISILKKSTAESKHQCKAWRWGSVPEER